MRSPTISQLSILWCLQNQVGNLSDTPCGKSTNLFFWNHQSQINATRPLSRYDSVNFEPLLTSAWYSQRPQCSHHGVSYQRRLPWSCAEICPRSEHWAGAGRGLDTRACGDSWSYRVRGYTKCDREDQRAESSSKPSFVSSSHVPYPREYIAMIRYCSCTTHRPFRVLMRKQLKLLQSSVWAIPYYPIYTTSQV